MKSKMITVDHRGYINTSRGRIFGPIVNKYRESIEMIWSMVASGMNVYEHLNSGEKILLTTSNFDRDNTPKNHTVEVVKPILTKPVDPAIPVNKKTDAELQKEVVVENPVDNEETHQDIPSEPEVVLTAVVEEEPVSLGNRPLSRKEKKELRRQQQMQDHNKEVVSNQTTPEENPVETVE